MSYAAYSNMILDYNVDKIRALNVERDARLAALKTKADAENYVKEVREKIAAIFNIPQQRSVPEVKICGTAEKNGFIIEKIIYYSRKNFPVTANLYRPSAPGKYPAVIFVCGHSGNGKASPNYQLGAINLARKGYVVLLIDPIAQGERRQYEGIKAAEGLNNSCTKTHATLGKQLRLCGEFFGSWRAFDAICGLDYLLSRPEVDPSRVGITGNSGGGTMTTFVQALDPRFTMAAPSCYVTSWQRNFENEVIADAEQMPPGILAAGCEMGDFILAYAPRPIILLGQKQDFFDERGLRETWARARKVYQLLGAEENLQYFIGPTYHGYSIENREAMYSFFNKHAHVDADGKEFADSVTFPDAELFCTASGQVMTSLDGSRTVRDFIREKAAELKESRKPLAADELKSRLRKILRLPEEISEPYTRMLRTIYYKQADAYLVVSRFGIETEPGIMTTLKILCDTAYSSLPAFDELHIYVPHLDSESEIKAMKLPLSQRIAGFDSRNTGESRANTYYAIPEYNYFQTPHGQDYHYDCINDMYGTSTVAKRVLDLLSMIVYVKACGVKKITMSARGLGVVTAVIAALISDDIAEITLYDAPESWQSMTEKPATIWPQSCMIPGILAYTDLPEIYEAVRSVKTLDIVNFVDEPIPEDGSL